MKTAERFEQQSEDTVNFDELMTGDEYLESLRDGREVYLYGEKVDDVTTHPAFRNSARSIARLYDAMHDPDQRDSITGVDRFGIRTHKFFMPSRSAEELYEAREAIAAWSRLSYGFMGRTPDYKASFMASLGCAPDFYDPYTENGKRWYEQYAKKGLFLNHVLVNPPVDRHKPVHEVADVYVHVERETDAGIVVSGAKMLATGSALTHATFVAQNSSVHLEPGKAENFALVFIAPVDVPGTKLICRNSYELSAHSAWDNPLSARFDENDAVLIFDNALIPWESVLVYRDIERANAFYRESGFFQRFNFQNGVRLGVKMDFMIGLFAKAIAANGTDQFRGVQVALGDLVAWRNMIWAMTTAMALDPEPGPGDSVVPKVQNAAALRVFASECWTNLRTTFEKFLGGSPIVIPSGQEDLLSEDLRPLIDHYYRGSDSSAEERIKLFKVIWDALGSEFGGRHSFYERNYAGNNEQVRLDAANFARVRGDQETFDALVESCLSDFDLEGWTSNYWYNPTDLTAKSR